MQVVLAFLAEHVIAHGDGKFYALGGGIEELEFGELPSPGSKLALLVRLRFTPEECNRQHQLELAGNGPDGKAFISAAGFSVRPQLPEGAPGALFQFVHQLDSVRFQTPGTHHFSIRLAGLEVGGLDLRVKLRKPDAATEGIATADTLFHLMQHGYAAFQAGDVEAAKAVFETMAKQFPESADAKNNLGFTQLVLKQPTEALKSFIEAERIGVRTPQILHANIACCHLLMRRREAAFETFKGLVSSPFDATGSYLVAVGRHDYQVVALKSSTDFVALMAVNASRSALLLGKAADAQTLAQVAQIGEFSPDENTKALFTSLRQELLEDLTKLAPGRSQAESSATE